MIEMEHSQKPPDSNMHRENVKQNRVSVNRAHKKRSENLLKVHRLLVKDNKHGQSNILPKVAGFGRDH